MCRLRQAAREALWGFVILYISGTFLTLQGRGSKTGLECSYLNLTVEYMSFFNQKSFDHVLVERGYRCLEQQPRMNQPGMVYSLIFSDYIKNAYLPWQRLHYMSGYRVKHKGLLFQRPSEVTAALKSFRDRMYTIH